MGGEVSDAVRFYPGKVRVHEYFGGGGRIASGDAEVLEHSGGERPEVLRAEPGTCVVGWHWFLRTGGDGGVYRAALTRHDAVDFGGALCVLPSVWG